MPNDHELLAAKVMQELNAFITEKNTIIAMDTPSVANRVTAAIVRDFEVKAKGRTRDRATQERAQNDAPPGVAATSEAEQAMAALDELIENCEILADSGPVDATDFASSVKTSAQSMYDTIDRSGRVSERQESAITNWTRGVNRWMERL